jgi:hypothetical protein
MLVGFFLNLAACFVQALPFRMSIPKDHRQSHDLLAAMRSYDYTLT